MHTHEKTYSTDTKVRVDISIDTCFLLCVSQQKSSWLGLDCLCKKLCLFVVDDSPIVYYVVR